MKTILAMIAVVATVGLVACNAQTQPQKDFIKFKEYCRANPKNEACVKYQEDGGNIALQAGGA